MSAFSSLIEGFFGLIGSLATNHSNSESVDKTNAANAEMMREQNAFNVDMWNRQNEYNLPINQMNRLKEAGINPALAYTNGVSGNSATSAPTSASAAPSISKSYSNLITDMMETMIKGQEIKNMKAEENLDKANTEATYKSIEVSDHVIVQIDESVKLSKEQRNYLAQQGEAIRKNIESVDVDIAIKKEQLTYQKIQNEIASMCKDADVKKRMNEAKISEQQLVNMVAQLYNIQADTELKGAQASNLKMDSHLKAQQYRLLGVSYERGKMEFDLWKESRGPDSTYGSWTSSSFWQGTEAILELLGQATGVIGNLLSGFKPKPNNTYSNTTIKIE